MRDRRIGINGATWTVRRDWAHPGHALQLTFTAPGHKRRCLDEVDVGWHEATDDGLTALWESASPCEGDGPEFVPFGPVHRQWDAPICEGRWVSALDPPVVISRDEWYEVYRGPFFRGEMGPDQIRDGDFFWLICTVDGGQMGVVRVGKMDVETRKLVSR